VAASAAASFIISLCDGLLNEKARVLFCLYAFVDYLPCSTTLLCECVRVYVYVVFVYVYACTWCVIMCVVRVLCVRGMYAFFVCGVIGVFCMCVLYVCAWCVCVDVIVCMVRLCVCTMCIIMTV